MTDEQQPESAAPAGGEAPASPEPVSDAPTTVAPAPPPPVAPPIAPPPAVAWQAPPVVVVKGQRTVLAAIAGILLLLGGIGGIILGLLVAVVGGTVISSFNFSQFGDVPELNGADPSAVVGGVVAFFGLLIVAYSIAYLLAGIGVLRNSGWARVLGIVVGIISGLIWLSGVTNANQIPDSSGAAGGGLFSIVALVIHVYIVVALLFFWRSRPTAVA
jgi:hypothetical protein